jgi:probable phosphoglycerate mutase
MTTFLLLRHGLNDWVGNRLAGWTPGVHLNGRGRAQAERKAERRSSAGISAIYTSPLERAVETAEPLARRLGLEARIEEALGEIRPGEWTGGGFAELEADERWRRFNSFRGGTRAPGGELMVEAQARMADALLRLRDRHPDGAVACVSHAYPLRAVLGYFLGAPVDLFARIEIGPASISEVRLDAWGALVLRMNDTAHLEGFDPG